MIQAESQKLLRSQQWHACLLGGAITLPLITFHTRRDEIGGSAFAALSSRKNVIQRKILCVFVLGTILASIPVANVNSGTLHSCLATVASNMNIVPETNYRWDGKSCGRRVKYILTVVLFDKDRAAKPETNCTSDTDGAERLVRKV